jgi:hypothetical protein
MWTATPKPDLLKMPVEEIARQLTLIGSRHFFTTSIRRPATKHDFHFPFVEL